MGETYKITTNDCIKILQKHLQINNFELLEYQEKSISGEVAGIMSGHYKLKTKAKVNNTIISNSFFVKRMLSQYNIQTQFIKESGSYEKENFAYGLLKELYEKQEGFICDYMANCYLSIEDQVFVFEDVSEDGYITNKCPADILDLKHLKLTLKMIAKFHAGSIIYEHKKSEELGRKYQMTDDFSQHCKEYMYRKDENYIGDLFYKTSTKSVLSLLDIVPYYKDNKNEIKNKFLKQVDRVYDLVKPSKEYLNVICHGDLWNSNLLFKYDNDNPVHCKILDFQALRYTVPAHDYLYIVHMNSFETDSRNNEVLSKFYYTSLQNYLKASNIDINNYMTYEQFLASIDYIYPFIVVQNACFANLCIVRINDNIPKSENLFAQCMYEDRSEWCIEAYKNNELFRNLVDLALKDLIKL